MAIDERARHRLHRKLEEILGSEEAGTLMSHLPPLGWGDLATKADVDRLAADVQGLDHRMKADLQSLEYRLTGAMERMARRLVMWTSSMVLAAAALAFAAGKFG
jgi:hypothetical protein